MYTPSVSLNHFFSRLLVDDIYTTVYCTYRLLKTVGDCNLLICDNEVGLGNSDYHATVLEIEIDLRGKREPI